jgi:5-guanidino-2-oxopentanoate decarboxylase
MITVSISQQFLQKGFAAMPIHDPENTIGEALVSLLEAYGVRTIFGIPGVHNVEMYRALPRSGITHVLTRHEQGAGFMADGFARATGEPGVCFTITGPGLTNIMTPLGQAWSDSSNVLVISSALDVADAAQGRGRLHEMISQHQAALSVTANAWRAYSAIDVQDAVARAFAGFAGARPRPAYLEIPLDLFPQPSGEGWSAHQRPHRPQAEPGVLEKATARIAKAHRPMIILGGGALDAGPAALRIAEATGAPVLTTTAGKGAIPAAHPNHWGYVLGLAEVQEQLQRSDCVLAAGTELSECDFWRQSFRLRAPLIRIDIDPASLARPHPATLAILGEARHALETIASLLPVGRRVTPPVPPSTPGDPLRQTLARVLAVIREALPEDTVVASDMTQIAYAANQVFQVSKPRTWIHPVGFATLGFALPAGIGAKFGVGEKPVAVLHGDYGIQYTINELGTAVEHKLPLPILLWNNNALGEIRDDMVAKGIQPNAVTLRNPDFQLLAKAYGARAEKPADLKALSRTIVAALAANGPTIIEMTPDMARG